MMKPTNPSSESHFADPLDRRLAGRLRRIAEKQRAPQRLRDQVFADLAAEQFDARRRFRWDLLAAGFGGALVSAAAALTLWLAAPNPAPVRDDTPWFDIALNNVTGEATLETNDPTVLRTWLEARVNHDLDVPAIPNAELKGGRLAYVGGIRGVAIEYTLNHAPLTYMTIPHDVMNMFAAAGDSVVTWSARGQRIVMWSQGGETRALVAPISRNELLEIAEHCRRTMI